jgi:hypothetical protein
MPASFFLPCARPRKKNAHLNCSTARATQTSAPEIRLSSPRASGCSPRFRKFTTVFFLESLERINDDDDDENDSVVRDEKKKEGTPTTRLERRGPLDATRFRRQKCATPFFFRFFFFSGSSHHVLFLFWLVVLSEKKCIGEDEERPSKIHC